MSFFRDRLEAYPRLADIEVARALLPERAWQAVLIDHAHCEKKAAGTAMIKARRTEPPAMMKP
mgnify:CR=1 FL=1